MKRVFFAGILFVVYAVFMQCTVFAQEIYQDENGVWRNRSASEIYQDSKGVWTDGTKAGIYKNEKGVWTNNSTSVTLNNVGKDVAEGVQAVTGAAIMGIAGFLEAPAIEALEGMGKDAKKRVTQNQLKRNEARRKEYERTHINDISSYERFEDPRDIKQ